MIMEDLQTFDSCFNDLASVGKHETILCYEPLHFHHTPIQEMFKLEYRGHVVSITNDGGFFSVRMDNNPLTDKWEMDWELAAAYVEFMSRKALP